MLVLFGVMALLWYLAGTLASALGEQGRTEIVYIF